MDTTLVMFYVLAAAALFSAYRVVTDPKIMHAALWLGATFLAVAGVFLLLTAEFLAAAQVLIYVGAVTTLIVFGIMLSNIEEVVSEDEAPWYRRVLGALSPAGRGGLALAVAAGFTGVMLWVYGQAAGTWPAAPAGEVADNVGALGSALFTRFAVPFEIASVILLAALVGAIILATREE